jgi:cell division protein FtsB
MLGAALIGAVLYAQWRQLDIRYLEIEQDVQQVENAERHLEVLELELSQSSSRVENLGNDPLEVENAIRKNKNFVLKDEIVFKIEDLPEGMAPQQP